MEKKREEKLTDIYLSDTFKRASYVCFVLGLHENFCPIPVMSEQQWGHGLLDCFPLVFMPRVSSAEWGSDFFLLITDGVSRVLVRF